MSEDSTATTQAFPPGGAGGFLGAGTAGSGMASSGTGSSTAATSPHEVARLLKRPKVRRLHQLRVSQMDPQQLCAGSGQLRVSACIGACCWLDACFYFQMAEDCPGAGQHAPIWGLSEKLGSMG